MTRLSLDVKNKKKDKRSGNTRENYTKKYNSHYYSDYLLYVMDTSKFYAPLWKEQGLHMFAIIDPSENFIKWLIYVRQSVNSTSCRFKIVIRWCNICDSLPTYCDMILMGAITPHCLTHSKNIMQLHRYDERKKHHLSYEVNQPESSSLVKTMCRWDRVSALI